LTCAERAADVGFEEADRVDVAVEQVGQDAPVGLFDLRDSPHRQAPVTRILLCHERTRLERGRTVTLHRECSADDDVGGAERRVDLAARGPDRVDLVAADDAVDRARLRRDGGVEFNDRRIGVDLDVNQLAGVLGCVGIAGDHHRHGFAHVADLVPRDHRLKHLDGALPGGHPGWDADIGDVGRRQHRDDLRVRQGAARVDSGDASRRDRAAHDARVQLILAIDVTAELRGSGQVSPVLDAEDRLPDVGAALPGRRARGHRRPRMERQPSQAAPAMASATPTPARRGLKRAAGASSDSRAPPRNFTQSAAALLNRRCSASWPGIAAMPMSSSSRRAISVDSSTDSMSAPRT
jgi:hypothetical protein